MPSSAAGIVLYVRNRMSAEILKMPQFSIIRNTSFVCVCVCACVTRNFFFCLSIYTIREPDIQYSCWSVRIRTQEESLVRMQPSCTTKSCSWMLFLCWARSPKAFKSDPIAAVPWPVIYIALMRYISLYYRAIFLMVCLEFLCIYVYVTV